MKVLYVLHNTTKGTQEKVTGATTRPDDYVVLD